MFRGLPTASLPLVQLYASPYLFTVPAYQRPYSWTTREANQLFEDISLAAGLSQDEPATPDYFLGTILLLDPEADATTPPPAFSGPRVFEVVDGQQRLVTLAILASILRDLEDQDAALDATGGRLADRLDAMVSVAPDERDISARRTRVRLHDSEQAFLESGVLARRKPAPSAQDAASCGNSGMQAVHDQLMREAESLTREERRRLALFLIEDCHVVVIITRDIDRAHRLFTVLNERGKPLDRKDILKAEVLRKVAPDAAARTLALWDDAQAKLGDEFEQFFSYLKTIHGNPKLPIITALRALVREHGSEQFMANIVKPLADGLHLVRNHAGEAAAAGDKPIAGALVSLNRLGKSDWVPAAMLAMAGYDAAPARTASLIIEIEQLAFLVRLLGMGADKRQRRFSAIVDAIKADPGSAMSVPAFDISREEQRTVAHHLKDLHRRNAPLSKLLLMRIEDALAGAPLTVDPADLSVEHVLPLRPSATSNWRRLFPDAEVRETCQGSLGNLALVTPRQNERAKNKDYAEKLAIYRESAPGIPEFVSNIGILEAKSWLPDCVFAREAQLLEVISRLWRIDVPPPTNGGRSNGR